MYGRIDLSSRSIERKDNVTQTGVENGFGDGFVHEGGVRREDHSNSMRRRVSDHPKRVRVHDGFAGSVERDVAEISGAFVYESSEDLYFQVRAIESDGFTDTHPAEVIARVCIGDDDRWRKTGADRGPTQVPSQ